MKIHRYFSLMFLMLIVLGSSTVYAQQDLSQQAYAVLQQNCLTCHGPAGAFRETLLLEHTALLETGAVVPGKPDASELYTRLLEQDPIKRMPFRQPKLSDPAILAIERWIQAGAPDWNTAPDPNTRFITYDTMLTTIQRHIASLDPFDRPFARYFSLTHLYNAGESPDELNIYRMALSKLINSLSWRGDIINPHPIDAAETIFYVSLFEYEWDAEDVWTQLEAVYPYPLEFDADTQAVLHKKLTDLREEMDCEVPFMQVDWFLATASLPPLYHDILGLPDTDRELEDKLDVDVARNIALAPGRRVWRAGFNDSGPSLHNRVVERHRSRYGAYWKSYDFAGSAGVRHIFTYPLGFEHDGGEVIFHLPNGLQGYYISDDLGNRIDAAPLDIVQNEGSDKVVRNGLSCIGCHAEGMKTFTDTVRDVIEQTRNPSYDRDHALRLYVSQEEMDGYVSADTERYKDALEATGNVFGGIIEPVSYGADAFQGALDASEAAAAIGMEEAVFLTKIRSESSLQRLGLTGLLSGENVKRDVWESNFSDLVACVYGDECVVPDPLPIPDSDPFLDHPIPDVNLRAAIAETLGKVPALLTTEDLARLTRLEADERGIEDLRGLEHATRLERIELRRNAISDLSPLEGLIHLNNIKLRGNQITDVSPLGGLVNVDWLGLEGNAIEDLRPLRKLIKLNGIGISGNPISDVSPLASLISLERIDAWRTPISDFSSLAKLPGLRWIELGNDRSISAIPSLKGLKALRRLEISECNISDLSPLTELTQLEWLSLVNNLIADVSPLAELTRLEHLNLDANVISDVSSLAKLTRLEILYLENNAISDVSPLAEFKNLERLDLRNNAISDFSPLDGLPDKTFVRMEGNPGFPSGGPKITGPWLWAIVPGTRLDDRTDFLSRATSGAATELKVATNGATEGKAVGKRKWALHRLSATGGNNINRMTDSLGWGTGEEIYDHIVYGSVILDSPDEQQTTMLVGSDDAVKVWLNGELVHIALVARGAGDYQDFFPVTLKQGKNVLLVALDNRGHGGFSGFFGFTVDTKYEVFQPNIKFAFSSDTTSIKTGDAFTVHLKTENADNLAGWQTNLLFDKALLKAARVTEGDFLKQGDGRTFFQAGTINNTTGKITGIKAVQLAKGKMTRQGTLFSVRFTAIADGESQLTVSSFQAGSRSGEKINATPPEITIVVGDGAPAAPSLRPDETALLHNYPNPFNPETWIPYQLAEPADVTIRIYAASGVLVRTLVLGYQPVGIYQYRSRAAYWDGKNAVGESVASGIYFYTLTAGDFTATRKMLIMK